MSPRPPRRTIAALACAALAGSLLLAACATAPVGDTAPGATPAEGSDEAELWYAMERAERELQRSPLLVRDPALNDYVRQVACSVAAAYCRDLRVYIMDVPDFNASMAPNGVMLVWTGGLLRMRDEAELAFVLGHETGHFSARHSIRLWRRVKGTSALINAFQILAYGAGAPNTAMLGGLAGYATLFKYTRDMEREADRLGFASTVARGYDPQSGVALWSRMHEEERTRRYERQLPVFSSHPATQERLSDIRAAANAQADAPKERRREAYRAATRPFLAHWLAADLGQRRYASSLLLIGGLLADAPPADRGLLTFYLGEAHRRRNAAGDRARAASLYAQAVALPGAPAAAWREHGYALRDAGQRAAARDALRRYLQDMPSADDRALVERELSRLGGPG